MNAKTRGGQCHGAPARPAPDAPSLTGPRASTPADPAVQTPAPADPAARAASGPADPAARAASAPADPAVQTPAPADPAARATSVPADPAARAASAPADPAAQTPGARAAPRVILIGNPNVGKSTLFNLLTGARQKTMNAPRTTVAFEAGQWDPVRRGASVRLLDLPGTYSLIALSPDEAVAAEAVAGTGEGILAQRPDLAVVVLDATALSSSLYLLAQVALAGVPVVAAVTMADVAQRRGLQLDQERLASLIGAPVVEVNPRLGRGAEPLGAAVAERLTAPGDPRDGIVQGNSQLDFAVPAAPEAALAALPRLAEPLFDWVAGVIAAAQTEHAPRATRSDKADRVLLRWWSGVPLFLAVLWGVFQLTTSVAAPLQEAFEWLVAGPLTGLVTAVLRALGADGGWLESLLVDGVMAGVGVVVSFLPLMAIMFAAIALLEDSGYMARVAFVADRLMRGIGLDGRAVLPLVIGFGCNLPALAATKTLPNARQRLLTGLLVPYASCTARLVVFLFIASAVFPEHAGTVVFGLYIASVAVIVLVGLALKRTAFRELGREPLVLALPAYQAPRVWPLLRSVLLRSRAFALRAGQVIVVLSVAVWTLMAVPLASGYSFGDSIPPSHSLFGQVSEAIAPVFAPAGFGDWHASAALLTGFVAKETVVGTLATTYGVEEPEDPALAHDLGGRVRATLERTSGGHPGAAAIAFMLFSLAYTPCMVAMAEQRRLFGGRVTAASVGLSVAAAWLLAVLAFQLGRLL